jgi:hypothetical protein
VEVCAAPSPGDSPAWARVVAGTAARLARLYGPGCAAELAEGDGFRAVLRLPWHEEPWPVEAGAES